MDGRGSCFIARYAGGAYASSKVNRIMLKYRPIAPKPAVSESVSGGSSRENSEVYVRNGRAKRWCSTRDNNDKRCYRKRRVYREGKKDEIVTLPLLPETPDRKESPASVSPSDPDLTAFTTTPISCVTDLTVVMPQTVKMVGSYVTVKCVTDTCVEGEALGSTDEGKRKSLEEDTCPGFITDGLNRVQWTNEAYRRLVCQGGGEGEVGAEIVWMVMNERLPVSCPAFGCSVRLQYTCREERNSLTMPCDVWRMEGGGFAWRLDVGAALCLGR
ncbi:hypothetical protein HHK36_029475 [Tetracentron sinense]|uniref:DUF7950 domain-containing protein n=1 Tax=Tetracentron sinense TaxID=13715 RepID=A0A834YB11_TETSI|nr:hypothetical protein HHK36_029475 [Tetracentron sinense]